MGTVQRKRYWCENSRALKVIGFLTPPSCLRQTLYHRKRSFLEQGTPNTDQYLHTCQIAFTTRIVESNNCYYTDDSSFIQFSRVFHRLRPSIYDLITLRLLSSRSLLLMKRQSSGLK